MLFNSPILFAALYNLFQGAQRAGDVLKRIPFTGTVIAGTKYGQVKGTQHFARGKIPYTFFRGIPYAKPPVGNLRFEPPEPHPGWSHVHDATFYGEQCWQVSPAVPEQPVGSENCLFLNVATRKVFLKGQVPSSGQRPVIVWIHGGHFMFGNSNTFPPKYFMEEDIVLITINYRLASFGFLNTGDGIVQGNMGLKDQTLALKWVQENIAYFNGDPKRVTIFGQSAGSVSVHMHTLSPMSRGLFSGAISSSGTALSPFGIIDKPESQAMEMSQWFGCPSYDKVKMVECLKQIPAKKLAGYHKKYVIQEVEGKRGIFGPTIEFKTSSSQPPFLPNDPLKLMQSGAISPTPWINGVNSGDGLVFLIPVMGNATLRQLLNSQWNRLAPLLMYYQDNPKKEEISKAVKQHYLHGKPIAKESLKEAGEMMSDRGFFLDSHYAALLHAKVAPTYSYYYAYEGLFSLPQLLFNEANIKHAKPKVKKGVGLAIQWGITNILNVKQKNKWGVSHGDELPLLFDIPLVRKEVANKDVDLKFSRKLIRLWVSFATNGIPNPSLVGEKVKWRSVKESNPTLEDIPLQRLLLKDKWSIVNETFFGRMQFWRRFNIS